MPDCRFREQVHRYATKVMAIQTANERTFVANKTAGANTPLCLQLDLL